MEKIENIEEYIKNKNLIYCPLIKDWQSKNDCEYCEMCS